MPQFLDRTFHGYRVYVRPDDWLRKPFVVPKLHFVAFFPYLSGSDIYFSVHIKLNEEKKDEPPVTLKYTWYLRTKDGGKTCNSGDGIAVISDKEYKTRLFLGNFPFTGEYKLDLKVTCDNNTQLDNVASFEVTSRADATLKLSWLLLGALLPIIGGIIWHFISR